MSDFDLINCLRIELSRLSESNEEVDKLASSIVMLPSNLYVPLVNAIREYCKGTISGDRSNAKGTLELLKKLHTYGGDSGATFGHNSTLHKKNSNVSTNLNTSVSQNLRFTPSALPLRTAIRAALTECVVGIWQATRVKDKSLAHEIMLVLDWWNSSQIFGKNLDPPPLRAALKTIRALEEVYGACTEMWANAAYKRNQNDKEINNPESFPMKQWVELDAKLDSVAKIFHGQSPASLEDPSETEIRELCEAQASLRSAVMHLENHYNTLMNRQRPLRRRLKLINKYHECLLTEDSKPNKLPSKD